MKKILMITLALFLVGSLCCAKSAVHKKKAVTRVHKKYVQLSSRSGNYVQVKSLVCTVSAYSAPCPIQGTGTRTASGRSVYEVINGRRVKSSGAAVDPRVIPLGAVIVIDDKIVVQADDTGGAIKGHTIDLRLPTRKAAMLFGRKRHVKVTVYVKAGGIYGNENEN